jgi:hypothetical protein
MRKWGAERGREVNVRYAEGFIQHKGHPFPTAKILEKTLKILTKG